MIIICSLEKDIYFQKEKKLFRNLYYKHGQFTIPCILLLLTKEKLIRFFPNFFFL